MVRRSCGGSLPIRSDPRQHRGSLPLSLDAIPPPVASPSHGSVASTSLRSAGGRSSSHDYAHNDAAIAWLRQTRLTRTACFVGGNRRRLHRLAAHCIVTSRGRQL